MTALLELKDIRRSYPSGDGPVEVLKGISLRVEAGEMALAIAYSTVLIVVMLGVVLGIEKIVGRAQIGRRAATPVPATPMRAGA